MKILLLLTLLSQVVFSASKLKDLVTIKGVRDNALIGYGLVIGLNGTGDSGGEITNESLKKMFQTLGLNPKQEIASSNVASVIVTAKLPPFARQGHKLDVTISSIGSAASLAGGTLLVTPLKGGDGNIYAVANGQISIGGLTQGAKFATSGKVVNGATVERELDLEFNKKKALRLSLNHPDFTTAARIAKTINQQLGGKFATAADLSTIDLIIPENYQRRVVELVAIMENFKVNKDSKAKIVINEKTGTIAAGGDIRLSKVAISHGNLILEVGEADNAAGKRPGVLHMMEKTSTLNDLVSALNAMGTSTEDLISIFQVLKTNGALVADIEFI